LSEISVVRGVRLSAVSAGIKKNGALDLVLIELCEQAHCAAVFTQNAFCAAPVTVARDGLSKSAPRYLLVNSGNANAGTGGRGMADARACIEAVAHYADCEAEQVLPFSTGVIGELLPVDVIEAAIPALHGALVEGGWGAAAEGIMTTDTVPKSASRQIQIAGQRVVVSGIAKGSGMIRPDMATMLAYIATDAEIAAPLLQHCLTSAVAETFNSITVDGDTSTNDACVLIATGKSGAPLIDTAQSESYALLERAVYEVCRELAQAIVRDGEGATKFVTVRVSAGLDKQECRQVAYTVAHSPLVKTALFASDPNWGRILAAVGRAGVSALDVSKVSIRLGDLFVVRDGGLAADYREQAGVAAMVQNELVIDIALGRGTAQAEIWTCDLSYDYVRINAEYRS